jgi:hypothetical protein
MNFSERTLTIMKNFATINPSLIFKPGKELRTISPQKTVMAMAKIEDEIPSKACVYDMSRFLSVYSLYSNPNIEFEDKNFTISEGKRKTKYVFADASMVISPPEKQIDVPTKDVEVSIEWADLQSVIKAAGVLQLPEIAFVGKDGEVSLKAIDSGTPSADSFGIELGKTEDAFELIIKTEYLKLLPQNYKVTLSSKGISKFEGQDVTYFIAIESKSSYKKG